MSAKARAFFAMPSKAQTFATQARARSVTAAKIATDTSRTAFLSQLSGRPLTNARPGRRTTGGTFADELTWVPSGDLIDFDVANIATKAPYYLIQEIGTGQSAAIVQPPGAISVRSQRGRLINIGLQWADGPGAAPTRPGHGSLQQIYPTADLNMSKSYGRLRRIRIRREIRGKHFIRDGGIAGFSDLEANLIADARRIFFP